MASKVNIEDMVKYTVPTTAIFVIIVAIVAFAGGMIFGQPRIINLEESQRNSLIADCERDTARLERTQERELEDQYKEFVERNMDIASRNSELIEVNLEINELWAEKFGDLNHTITETYKDLNRTIIDMNKC